MQLEDVQESASSGAPAAPALYSAAPELALLRDINALGNWGNVGAYLGHVEGLQRRMDVEGWTVQMLPD